MTNKIATVKLFEAKGHVGANLNGRKGYGPNPAAALRDLARLLDEAAGQPERKSA